MTHKMAGPMQHLSANTTMHVISSPTRTSTESDALKQTASFPPPRSCSKHVGNVLWFFIYWQCPMVFIYFLVATLHQSTLASASTSTLNILLEKFNSGVTMRLKSYGQSTTVLMLKPFSQYHTTLGVVFLVFFLELLTHIISYSMSQFT